MEKIAHCFHCGERHIVSETMDGQGNVVGLFCNRKQAMVVVKTTRWNGEDVYDRLERFAAANVDTQALRRIKPEKVEGLTRKIAYLFLQTEYAKERKINYFFVVYHMRSIIRRMKAKAARQRAEV
ncbi:hypothetical protein [Brevibacillus thermoruber]|jgi:uncharacterized protein (DUF849 family)|uniref:hypothetical protein n=1 Tax=Brevibacillus thermoruber TaxID=33942 RepID=UPI0004012B65|nr:hypothetical protein [Brevibacillus thermoruber]